MSEEIDYKHVVQDSLREVQFDNIVITDLDISISEIGDIDSLDLVEIAMDIEERLNIDTLSIDQIDGFDDLLHKPIKDFIKFIESAHKKSLEGSK